MLLASQRSGDVTNILLTLFRRCCNLRLPLFSVPGSGPVVGTLNERKWGPQLTVPPPVNSDIREFKKRPRLRQRQRQKAVILLVKRTKIIVLHVRHAFFNISLPYSSKLLREMTNFKVLTTTWANYSESFSLTLYFKSVPTKPVIGHFAHIE